MRALLVTFGSILEPRGGLQVRARITLEVLTSLGAHVSVVSTEEAHASPGISVLRRRPFYGWSPGLIAAVRRAAPGCDVVVVENAMLMPAVAMAGVSAPIVWDTNECQTLHYARLPKTGLNRLRGLVWRRLEAFAARRCKLALAVSKVEANWWRELYPQLEAKLMVVDHAPRLVESEAVPASARKLHHIPPGRVLLFAGTLAAKHNAAAAGWLLEMLAPLLPADVTLVMAGPGTERLSRPSGGRVVCLGDVDDLDAVIEISDLCLAPLLSGAGVKTKVLHYLAHGKPVAGTPVAFEGLEDAPGLLSHELDELPYAIMRWLGTGSVTDEQLASEQRAWAEARHGRSLVAREWQEVLDRLQVG